MRQGTYLNVILTVNAVLLSALVWTQVADRPAVSAAQAQQSGGTMISAADQRQRIIESLRDVRQAVDATNRILERGNLRVHVANASELRAAQSSKSDATD